MKIKVSNRFLGIFRSCFFSFFQIFFLNFFHFVLFIYFPSVGDFVKYPSTTNPEGERTNWTVVQIVHTAKNIFPTEEDSTNEKKLENSKIEIPSQIPNLFSENESKAVKQIIGQLPIKFFCTLSFLHFLTLFFL